MALTPQVAAHTQDRQHSSIATSSPSEPRHVPLPRQDFPQADPQRPKRQGHPWPGVIGEGAAQALGRAGRAVFKCTLAANVLWGLGKPLLPLVHPPALHQTPFPVSVAGLSLDPCQLRHL